MYNFSLKYKGFVLLLLKLLIVAVACIFIFNKLTSNELISFEQLLSQFYILFSKNIWMFIGILILTDANWILETYKWKNLISVVKKINFFEAFEQCLSSHTTSLITPNKIGEYGVKALYYNKDLRKKVVVLNFIGNTTQLTFTVFFGLIGLLFIFLNYTIKFPIFNLQKVIFFIVILIGFILFRKQLGWYKFIKYFRKFSKFLKSIPKIIYLKTAVFSLLRYLIFSHQFYFLLKLVDVEINYFILMSFIYSMYFIASLIPTLTIFDWVIKGSVAVWLFQIIGLNELLILTVTTFMWLLNFGIPALLGSVFVLNFKLSKTT